MNDRGNTNDGAIRTNMFLKPQLASRLRAIFHNTVMKDCRQFDIALSQVYENGLCEIIAVRRDPKLSLSYIMNELQRCFHLIREQCLNSSTANDDLNGTIELSDGDDSVCVLSPARSGIRKVSFKRTLFNDSSVIIENSPMSKCNEPFINASPKRFCLGNVSDLVSQSSSKVPSQKQHNLEIHCYNESPHSPYSRNVTFKQAHDSDLPGAESAPVSEIPSTPQDDEADTSVVILGVYEDPKPGAPLWSSGNTSQSSFSQSQKSQDYDTYERSGLQEKSSIWSELAGKATVWLKTALTHSSNKEVNDDKHESKTNVSEVLNDKCNGVFKKSAEVAAADSSEDVPFKGIEDAHTSQHDTINICENLDTQESSSRNDANETDNVNFQIKADCCQENHSNSIQVPNRAPSDRSNESLESEKDGSCQSSDTTANKSQANFTTNDPCADLNICSTSDTIIVESDDDNDIIFEKELKNVTKTPTLFIDDSSDGNEVEIVDTIGGKKRKKKKKKKISKSLAETIDCSLAPMSKETAQDFNPLTSTTETKISTGSTFTASSFKSLAPDFIPLNSTQRANPNSFVALRKAKAMGAQLIKVKGKKLKKASALRHLQNKSLSKTELHSRRVALKHLQNKSLREADSTSRRGNHVPKTTEPKEAEKKHIYDGNVINPNAAEVPQTGLRPIVIDASNVAIGHGRGVFSVKGLKICIKYFSDRGHKVYACVPKFRRFHVSPDDRQELDQLETMGILSFTPSRTMVDGTKVASYDDRFIVQVAHELGGIIVSTDNYRDLLAENDAWRETIEKRLLMFTWVGDMLMFPNDPLGRNGPHLQDFLRFPDPPAQQ